MTAELHGAEDPSESCQPDILLPTQMRRGHATTPEEALIAAVLEDAIACLRQHRGARASRGRRLFREAEHWFLLEQPEWPFSFASICACLGLEADGVRRALGLGYGADRSACAPALTQGLKSELEGSSR